MSERIGEIIQVSTTRFLAQSDDLSVLPHFGSFMKTQSQGMNIYGLVFNVYETSIDPNRRAMAFGIERDELLRCQPQIAEFLKVEFEAAVIGFADAGYIRAYLPPFPPRIHSFVYPCDSREVIDLTEDLEFIRSVNALPGLPVEELAAASIRLAYAERGNDSAFLTRAGQEIAQLLKDEYEKARSIIRRISDAR
ncbi:MAG: hypothetical protein A2074_06250 [Candidatus Aquicultor primus]|uniref:Helicase HerA barrel domain-containing protein n=1 Tax=Candidatus Aquicultor primus TaxID=1797195 RepID=A0A1F2ULY8_9ACTN|nr:MAG: hypothetical protein A2074_06250 [Candidatus Aquicultor primus]